MFITQDLLTFIAQSPSPFHAARASEAALQTAGFTPLLWGKPWLLESGGRYYTKVFGSSLFAFRVGEKSPRALRIAAAHTDFPGFRVKPAASEAKDGYGLMNVEPYGGLILSSWLDRPLSLAGEVVLRGKDPFHPEPYLIDLARPLLTIPRLAIHLNREVNESGEKLDRQTSLTPLAALLSEEDGKDFFLKKLAREIGHQPEDILSYDFTVYAAETGCTMGFDGELLSAPRLDNLAGVRACLDGLIDSAAEKGIHLVALFDHEEVGSRTKQGAASALLPQLLSAIYRSLSLDEDDLAADIADGFLLSVDAAHALHPNYPDKADPTNRPRLGKGLVIKQAAGQSYVGDATAAAIVQGLCEANDIPWQTFANRSSIPGGSTLGAIASAHIGIRGQDVGVPLLAMHAARETMAAADQKALTRLIGAFFS
ncbi:MAG: M18 family aminopeptidase [Schwartzia sp. (in: firmicutes)]